MDEDNLPNFDRNQLIGNIITVLETVPENAVMALIDSLKKKETLDSVKIKKITSLSGEKLESVLLLFQNKKFDQQILLVALESAVAATKNSGKNLETIDLSWTGPVQFSVEGRTTPSVIQEMIKNARVGIIIVGYSITSGAENLIKLLHEVTEKGVEVIFVIHSDDENNNLTTLSELWHYSKKPKVYTRKAGQTDVYFKIHAKMVVVDSIDLLVTSANLTWHGMTNNFEVGLRVKGRTAKKAQELIKNLIESGYLESVKI